MAIFLLVTFTALWYRESLRGVALGRSGIHCFGGEGQMGQIVTYQMCERIRRNLSGRDAEYRLDEPRDENSDLFRT